MNSSILELFLFTVFILGNDEFIVNYAKKEDIVSSRMLIHQNACIIHQWDSIKLHDNLTSDFELWIWETTEKKKKKKLWKQNR